MKNAAIVVTSAKIEGNALVVEAQTLDTPAGRELKESNCLLNARGIGSIIFHGEEKVVEGYKLIAIDCVLKEEPECTGQEQNDVHS